MSTQPEKPTAESALEASGDTFFVFDLDTGRPVRWNRIFGQVTGFSEEEIGRLTVPDDVIAPEDLAAAREALAELVATGYARTEVLLQTRDGRKIPYEYVGTMIDTGGERQLVCSVGRDMTDRRRMEDAMRRSEERHRGFLDSLSAGVVAHGPDGGVLYWNRMALELLGLTVDELTGAAVEAPEFRFLHVDGSEMAVDDYPIDRTLSSGSDLSDYVVGVVQPRGGNIVWVVCNSHRMLDGDGTLEYVLVSFLDITELRRVDEERRRFEAQMLHTQKLESLGLMAGGIAHDFNNLLMAILGNADLALHELPSDSPVRTNIQDIGRAAHRASGLAQQMLAYSGRGRFVVEPLDLGDILTDMRDLLKATIPRMIELETHLGAELPAVKADADQIRQVVMNLITNAAEAIWDDESGRITFTTGVVDCDEQDLEASHVACVQEPGRYAYIEVQDNGCGMDDETLGSLFDPFFTTKFTGRGLGLAAVLGIVRGHGGAVTVDSSPGSGSRFRVLLPALEAGTPELNEAGDEPRAEAWRGSGLVLVVDDEPSVRRVATQMIARFGFEVIEAADGLQAVELHRRHADALVCILLDLTMPGIDGGEACRRIRRLDAAVPIIISSGFEETEFEVLSSDCHANGFIRKPYISRDLGEVLRKVLPKY